MNNFPVYKPVDGLSSWYYWVDCIESIVPSGLYQVDTIEPIVSTDSIKGIVQTEWTNWMEIKWTLGREWQILEKNSLQSSTCSWIRLEIALTFNPFIRWTRSQPFIVLGGTGWPSNIGKCFFNEIFWREKIAALHSVTPDEWPAHKMVSSLHSSSGLQVDAFSWISLKALVESH